MPITAENGYVFVPRNEWDAQVDFPRTPLRKPVREIYIHHTVTPATADPCADARRVESVLDRRGLDGYNFLVHPSGVVLELAGYNHQGEHTRGRNGDSIAISFIGNYMTQRATVDALVAAARTINLGKFVQSVALDLPIANIRPHSAVVATACPGSHLTQPWINGRSGIDWIRFFTQTNA